MANYITKCLDQEGKDKQLWSSGPDDMEVFKEIMKEVVKNWTIVSIEVTERGPLANNQIDKSAGSAGILEEINKQRVR